MVTGQQVRRLRQKLMQGKTQEAAAAAAGSPGLLRDGVVRSATSVPMSQCGGTLLPILRQDSPNVAFTHSQNLCRLIH